MHAPPTRFWLLRHALVEQNARAVLYGCNDVPLCPETLLSETPAYASLARHLPRPAQWVVTPLSRTRLTAQAIFDGGYPPQRLGVEPDLIEQHLGEWQGMAHADLPAQLAVPAHPFWPLAATERPPGGETMNEVIARAGACMERLAARWPGQDVVIVAHGGSIRAAVAHALGITGDAALHLAIQNISLTRLERHAAGWRLVGLNALSSPAGAYTLAV